MNSELWWLYDVIAAVIIIAGTALSAKKGLVKSAFHLIGYILAVVLAFSISGSVSGSLYKNTVRSSNIDKLNKSMESDYFMTEFKDYLEGLDYNISVKKEKLNTIFASGTDVDGQLVKYINNINGKKADSDSILLRKIHEGYASITKKIVSRELSKYAAASAAEILKDTDTNIDDLAPLLSVLEDNHKSAAAYIADNYISQAYQTVIRLIVFTILLAVIILLTVALVKAFTDDESYTSPTSHVIGGIIGIVHGGIFTFAATAILRLYAIMGSNEKIFFENSAVDKTYIFKYFYNFIMKM
ncbi:MAG: CvpA family protein [Ruminococcus sp.]|nr:CvpA family protein [Ruminococcus sp.]